MNLLMIIFIIFNFSDTMGNKGAYINLDGKTLTPKFQTYDAVVSQHFDNIFALQNLVFPFAERNKKY